MTILLAVVFGVLIGLLLGMVGGGGSVLTVPILVYLLNQSVHEATATSLVIVGATALIGVLPHAREGRVSARTALLFGGAGIGGALAGSVLNGLVSGPSILMLFGVLMLVVAVRMIRGPGIRGSQPARDETPAALNIWLVLAVGLSVGVLTGFFGVGGGFLIVPALVMLLKVPMRVAIGTSLAIIAINSAAGVATHLSSGEINYALAGIFVLGGLFGVTVGGRMAGRVDEVKLSQGFAGLIVLVALFLISKNALILV